MTTLSNCPDAETSLRSGAECGVLYLWAGLDACKAYRFRYEAFGTRSYVRFDCTHKGMWKYIYYFDPKQTDKERRAIIDSLVLLLKAAGEWEGD